jgi:hypothetical protein
MMRCLAATVCLLCLAAIKPPVPRLPHGPIESPKGKEQRMAVRQSPAAPRAVIANNRLLTWTWTANADNPATNVVFVVHSSPNLAAPVATWPTIAVCTTNGFPFVLSASIPSMFYYVRASNVVNGLASP